MNSYRHLVMLVAVLAWSGALHADLYLELGFDSGGDRLASTTTGDSINAGGGVKFAIGTQNRLGDGSTAIRFAAGYLFDSLDAIDGSADFSAITLDGVYLMDSGPHTFGIGATWHMSPEYSQTGGGYADIDIKFDDAVGLLLEYGYSFDNGFKVGARYTDLNYDANNISLDASSFGLFISSGF